MQVNIFIYKIQAEELLEKNTLTTIIANPSSIVWESKKEIRLNGNLFDVKSYYQNKQGQYVLTGLFDYQEMKLLAQLNNLGKQKSKQQNFLFLKILSLQSIANNYKIDISKYSNCYIKPIGYIYSKMLKKGFATLVLPPPKNNTA